MGRTTKAFGYLRVSGRGQLPGDGFDRQRAAIQSYAKSKDIRVVKWFEEQASGKTDADERPAFQEMLSEMLSNGCRTVFVESLDRLAREYRVQEQLLIYMASREIALIPANTGENVTEALMGDPMRRALVQIQGIFAELDKNLLVAKLRKARQRIRTREGRCEGRTRFGNDPRHPEEKEVIKKIKNLSAKGLNYSQIADKLNNEQVPTRNTAETVEKEKQQVGGAYRKPKKQSESKWYPATVSRILARANAD